METFAQVASLANNEVPGYYSQRYEDESKDGTKRKSSDSGVQQRAKRNRYTSIACNEVSTPEPLTKTQTYCKRTIG